jgi:hypothetical protein
VRAVAPPHGVVNFSVQAPSEVYCFIAAMAGDRACETNHASTFPGRFPLHQAISETLLYPNSSAAWFAFPPRELKTTLSG